MCVRAGGDNPAKPLKTRPFGYCDRVLFAPGEWSARCPFKMAATYSNYKSVPLCLDSDHNAVVAQLSLSWVAATQPPAPASDAREG